MRNVIAALLIGTAMIMGLAGCRNTEREKEELKALADDLKEELKEEIKGLKEERESEPEAADMTEAVDFTYTVEELQTAVSDIAERVDETVPAGTAEEQKQYRDLKAELEKVEDMLDLYEDELEQAYYEEKIQKTEYREADRRLEELEHELEQVEDSLELLFPAYEDS